MSFKHVILATVVIASVIFGSSLLARSTKVEPVSKDKVIRIQPYPYPSQPSNQTVPTQLTLDNKNIGLLNLDDEQTVTLYGEVDYTAKFIADAILAKAKSGKAVYLLIDSPGGSVFDGTAIISAIQSANAPVHTVCLNLCASMAAMIHQYGKERLMVDRATLMFHDAAGGVSGYVPQMLTRINYVTRYVNKMFAYAAERSGKNPEEFIASLGKEFWIDAEDAVEQKFADKIVSIIPSKTPTLNTQQLEQRNRGRNRLGDVNLTLDVESLNKGWY